MFFIMSLADLRKVYAAKRDALSHLERVNKSEEIGKRLVSLPVFKQVFQALFYVSFKSEVDTTTMRQTARGLGLGVAVPRIDVEFKRMVFHDVGNAEKLETGAFGLLQPSADSETITELQDLSVVVVPGLVFDLCGNRLGWGGGYYDRFLSGEGKGLPSIGLAFDIQIAEILPVQAHDVSVDWIVTETRIIDCVKREGH